MRGMVIMERGMKKWRPFAAMPQQFTAIQQMIDNQTKISRPILDEDQLEENNRILIEALERNPSIRITYYKDGRSCCEEGQIIKIDPYQQLLYMLDCFEFKCKYPLRNLIKVELIEDNSSYDIGSANRIL